MICLVTDRHRLADRLALNRGTAPVLEALVDIVIAAAEAGVDLVQMRENDLPTDTLTALVRRCVGVVEGTSTRIVVNDRLDVALGAGAHGVHLKDAPIAIDRVRTIVPRGFLIGQSIHGVDRAGDAVDYLIFGTLFPTRSKPDAAPARPGAVEAVVRRARAPVLGIGGVNLRNLADVAATGAAGIAAVDLFLPTGPGRLTPLQEIVNQVRRTFGTMS